ncbi:hypothetical protein CK501_11145 [Halovibrio salipaludis]|uniref:Uncharacterized protein n=2 Tax=Halovibrio salipaludis TaxID=2032626 RepID=A0A2A2F688_9GAMM|nr:hypothetical protein CK501_11145 [Halovibrio salipaludis]
MDGHPVTGYFKRNVLQKRSYLKFEWCLAAVNNPVYWEIQSDDDRVRYWTWVPQLNRYLRVVTLEDGITIHNAFPDRRFKQ